MRGMAYHVEILRHAYSVWKPFVIKYGRNPLPPAISSALAEAERILAPFDDVLPLKISGEEYFSFLSGQEDFESFDFSDIFYTALLNIGRKVRHVITKKSRFRRWLGWGGLRKGVLELTGLDCDKLAKMAYGARGGIVIQRSIIDELANDAIGGTFVNHGECRFIGWPASDGLFMNYGAQVSTIDPERDGFLNDFHHGFGYEATGGVFITTKSGDYFSRGAIILGPEHLAVDKKLFELVEEMRVATVGKVEVDTVTKLSAKIKSYCEKTYAGRI